MLVAIFSAKNINKVLSVRCAQTKGELETRLEYDIDKLTKLHGADWHCAESDKKLLVVFSSDGVSHQVIIEGNENVISFSLN